MNHVHAFVEEVNFVVTIDYALSLEEMVAAGKYDLIYPHGFVDSETYPINGQGVIECKLKLINVRNGLGSEKLAEYFASFKLIPPSAEHVLAFGAKYPEQQRKITIVGVGDNFWNKGSNGLFLDEVGSGRRLSWCTSGPGSYWSGGICFLAVDGQSSAT